MKQSTRKFWIRLLKGAGILYVLYLLAGFFAVPRIVESVLENRVAEELDRAIYLEKASFNPFTLSLELIGLTVEDDGQENFIEVGRLFVNPQIFPLLTRRVSVKEFSLADTIIRLKLEKDGSLNIDQLLNLPEAEGSEEASKPFHFTIGLINVDNVNLELADDTRTLPFQETIGPVSFVAENLKSDLDSESPYDFAAKIGEETTIAWAGDVSLNPVSSHGSFSIANLELGKAKSFWHDLLRADIGGIFSVSGSYGLKFDADSKLAYFKEGQVALSSFSLEDPEEETQVGFAELRIDGIEANWPENKVIVESVTLAEPNAVLVRDESGVMATPLREFAVSSGGGSAAKASNEEEFVLDALIKSVSIESGSVEVIDRAFSENPEIRLTGIGLRASNIAPFDDKSTAQVDLALLVNGSGATKISGAVNIPNQSVKGTLSLAGLDLATFQNYVALYSNAEIDQGILSLDVDYDADLRSSSFDARADVKLETLNVKELNGGKPVFEAASMSIENASYAKDSIKIDRVVIDHPVTTIAMDQDGLSLSRLAKSEDPIQEGNASEVPRESSIPVSIGQVTIIEGRTHFIDNTLSPSHRSSMTGMNLSVKNVSTEKGEKANVSIKGGFERGGSLSFSGDLEPLDFKNYSRLKLDLSSFDLSATAPYWRKYLGRGLDKGMLNVDASFDIKGNILDGSNGIMIDQLTLGEKVESEDSLGLPIGLAVAILKDREGKMDLPPLKLSGDLDDPSISISGIVMKALGNIIVKIATSPFSVLGKLGGGSGDEDLSTLRFAEGAFELNASQQSQLDKMAKILVARPALKVDLAARLDEVPEVKIFQRILISNKSLDGEASESGSADPIAMLRSYDPASYEEKAKAVYRDLMGIVVETPADPVGIETEEASEVKEAISVDSKETEKRGLFGNVATLLKKVTGKKVEETKEASLPKEPSEEAVILETSEVVVKLPPLPEIEARLFEEEEFQIDASWLERLAQERTKNVKDYLVTAKGIEASRVFISGKASSEGEEGDTKPISAVKFELTD